jgi:hypothetical protein
MKQIETVHLSSSVDAGELQAAVKAAQIGTAFSLSLGEMGAAILTLSARSHADAAPGGHGPPQTWRSKTRPASGISKREKKRLSREADFVEITNLLQSGEARSVHDAAMQVMRGKFNRAHYRGKQYRKTHGLSASAFSKKITDFPMT